MPIRLRLALVVTAASAILLGLGGMIFLKALHHSLRASLDANLTRRSAFVGRVVTADTLPDGSAAPGRPPLSRRLANRDALGPIEVVEPSGKVFALAGSPIQIPRPMLLAGEHRPTFMTLETPGASAPLRILASGIRGRPGWITVVGSTLGPTTEALARVRQGLLEAGGPIVALATLGAWWLAGAALAPVERMRVAAAEISEYDTSARLDIPATRDELAALGHTMDDLISRLQQALRRQAAFISDAGHELRTPLAMLRAELELATNANRTKEELAEAVARAGEDAARLSFLAEDLLTLATADEGHLALHLEPVGLDELVMALAASFAASAARHEVAIQIDVPPGETIATLDHLRIRQALGNLVDNALRLSPPHSTISLAVSQRPGEVVIEVRDQGPGFPPDFLPHAFDRFRRPDGSRSRSGGGSGLGLSIVRTIAQAHGGHASAQNLPEGGAAVRITLPLALPGR